MQQQPTKLALTNLFLSEGKISATPNIIKSFMLLWWATPYSPIGLRLTATGNQFLSSDLRLTKYTHTIKEDTVKSLNLYLRMNKFLTFPYYIQGNNTIILYGEHDSIMLTLCSNNLQQYLENLTR